MCTQITIYIIFSDFFREIIPIPLIKSHAVKIKISNDITTNTILLSEMNPKILLIIAQIVISKIKTIGTKA